MPREQQFMRLADSWEWNCRLKRFRMCRKHPSSRLRVYTERSTGGGRCIARWSGCWRMSWRNWFTKKNFKILKNIERGDVSAKACFRRSKGLSGFIYHVSPPVDYDTIVNTYFSIFIWEISKSCTNSMFRIGQDLQWISILRLVNQVISPFSPYLRDLLARYPFLWFWHIPPSFKFSCRY